MLFTIHKCLFFSLYIHKTKATEHLRSQNILLKYYRDIYCNPLAFFPRLSPSFTYTLPLSHSVYLPVTKPYPWHEAAPPLPRE